MITSQSAEGLYHGCNSSRTHSVRCHFRPSNNYRFPSNFVRSWMLDDVGNGVGACLGTSNLCVFRVSYGNRKGES